MSVSQPRRHSRRPIVAAVLLGAALLAVLAVWSNVLGVGDRLASVAHRIELIVDPPPDRPVEEVRVTPRPDPAPTPTPTPRPTSSGAPDPAASAPAPTATPKPLPVRARVDVTLLRRPERSFISQMDKDSCAVAGTQMVLAIHGKAPLTVAFQKELASRIDEWESRRDSRNGG